MTTLVFPDARAIDAGVWVGRATPEDLRRLPGAPLKIAGPHLVLLSEPVWTGRELRARVGGVTVVALGNGEAAVFLSATTEEPSPFGQTTIGDAGDDNAFFGELAVLGSDMDRIGRALIARIRSRFAGALARTERPRRFVERPDNFWGIEIQRRAAALKLIVRAREERLAAAGLPYESERPPTYFAMTVRSDTDMDPALRFLELADRKAG